MKIRKLICCLLGLLFSVLVGCSNSNQNKASDGRVYDFGHLQQHWVFLNYWASWCLSCHLEVPQLNAFYHQHQGTVWVLGVEYDGLQGLALKKAMQTFDVQYPVLENDPKFSLKLPDLSAVPMTFVINPQGKVVASLLGAQTTKTLNQVLAKLQKGAA